MKKLSINESRVLAKLLLFLFQLFYILLPQIYLLLALLNLILDCNDVGVQAIYLVLQVPMLELCLREMLHKIFVRLPELLKELLIFLVELSGIVHVALELLDGVDCHLLVLEHLCIVLVQNEELIVELVVLFLHLVQCRL